ncbi:MAG: hypothetical protein HHJ11_00390 [Phycicoccus sp.]|nr:hypothetical protein [Phycicoccus sp.]NMM33068.1 hypothetical protein [Phycicoccus sp.]
MPDLEPVFVELRRRLSLHEDVFRRSVNLTDANGPGARKANEPEPETSYLLLGAAHEKYPDGLMFAAVKIGKRYVSYHLMCVYVQPDLLKAMSPQLRKRMQGKSCFNFTKIDEALFDELSGITVKGREMYAARGWLATSPTGQIRKSETSHGSAPGG